MLTVLMDSSSGNGDGGSSGGELAAAVSRTGARAGTRAARAAMIVFVVLLSSQCTGTGSEGGGAGQLADIADAGLGTTTLDFVARKAATPVAVAVVEGGGAETNGSGSKSSSGSNLATAVTVRAWAA